MVKTEKFNIGFLQLSRDEAEMFLSVTPGFESGPGILRDGITQPRMHDPHAVEYVCHARGLSADLTLGYTTNAHVQRAGTWTLYHHLREFQKEKGSEWQILGVQSCGDLTMNPWHLAYLRRSHLKKQSGTLCGLLTPNDPQEPYHTRVYRALIKWNDSVYHSCGLRYQFQDIRIFKVEKDYVIKLSDPAVAKEYNEKFVGLRGYISKLQDIAPLLEFALTGKPIIEKGRELALPNMTDRFQDVRHIFNLPIVPCHGHYDGQDVSSIIFGEYKLYWDLNVRRASLLSPLIIDLDIETNVRVKWEDLKAELLKRHFDEAQEPPNRRGQFREYMDNTSRRKVEIFFRHNVYPFGVIGLPKDDIVCLASGGLSGRVGNTLEGVTRIMFDFFGCEDAMVLDEGYDTFQIVNPMDYPIGEDGKPDFSKGNLRYNNDQMLAKIRRFTIEMADREHKDSLKPKQPENPEPPYHFPGGMKDWPLNKPLFDQINNDDTTQSLNDYDDYSDVLIVSPNRSQMRSIIIFAKRTKHG